MTPVSSDLRASKAVSCTSATISKRNLFPFVLADRAMPMEESPIAGQYIGTPALYADVTMPSLSVSFEIF